MKNFASRMKRLCWVENVFSRSGLLWVSGLLWAGGCLWTGGVTAEAAPQRKLTPSGAGTFDAFGVSVSLDGDTALVGAWQHRGDGADGAAYVYDTATGQEQFKLISPNPQAGQFFGFSSDLSGDTAIVGEWFGYGSAHLINTRTGEHLFELRASDEDYNDRFGEAVAISGGTAIVGAGKNDDAGFESGAAYLFDVATGQQTFKLLASDDAARDNFGISVAIHDDLALVGAWRDGHSGERIAGSAYLFDAQTGQQRFKLTADDAAEDDEFGISVALNDQIALIGARDKGVGGAAYVFDLATGQQLMKLTPEDVTEDDKFGHSVAVSGSLALIGAPMSDHRGLDSGAAYLFDLTTGAQLARITAFDGAAEDGFGQSVAIDGALALVGAWHSDGVGAATGAAYLIRVPEPASLIVSLIAAVAFSFSHFPTRSSQ